MHQLLQKASAKLQEFDHNSRVLTILDKLNELPPHGLYQDNSDSVDNLRKALSALLNDDTLSPKLQHATHEMLCALAAVYPRNEYEKNQPIDPITLESIQENASVALSNGFQYNLVPLLAAHQQRLAQEKPGHHEDSQLFVDPLTNDPFLVRDVMRIKRAVAHYKRDHMQEELQMTPDPRIPLSLTPCPPTSGAPLQHRKRKFTLFHQSQDIERYDVNGLAFILGPRRDKGGELLVHLAVIQPELNAIEIDISQESADLIRQNIQNIPALKMHFGTYPQSQEIIEILRCLDAVEPPNPSRL